MNIIDIVILGFILLYALNGMYKGFLPSLLNLGGFFLSWIGAFLFYPLLSGAFIKSDFFQSFRFFQLLCMHLVPVTPQLKLPVTQRHENGQRNYQKITTRRLRR